MCSLRSCEFGPSPTGFSWLAATAEQLPLKTGETAELNSAWAHQTGWAPQGLTANQGFESRPITPTKSSILKPRPFKAGVFDFPPVRSCLSLLSAARYDRTHRMQRFVLLLDKASEFGRSSVLILSAG
jgi:hypothetical protein